MQVASMRGSNRKTMSKESCHAYDSIVCVVARDCNRKIQSYLYSYQSEGLLLNGNSSRFQGLGGLVVNSPRSSLNLKNPGRQNQRFLLLYHIITAKQKSALHILSRIFNLYLGQFYTMNPEPQRYYPCIFWIWNKSSGRCMLTNPGRIEELDLTMVVQPGVSKKTFFLHPRN